MKKIKLDKLPLLYDIIAKENDLFLPIEKAGQVDFAKYETGANVNLNKLKTTKSAKDVFFPQTQDLVRFEVNGKEIKIDEPIMPENKQVIFGVKACDARSFELLDMAYLDDFGDKFYEMRRQNTTVVTLACNKPDEACFCSVYGIDASNPKGDVSTYIVGDELYWQENTEKGATLTEKVKDLFENGDDKKVENKKAEIKAIIEKLPYAKLSLKGFDGDSLMEKFNSKKWKELSDACLGCGTCTFICPTCQCYDVRDFKTKTGVQRFRCWDSCMFADFTKCAHGNTRPTQMQRYRQRFMHKLVYFPSNHDGVYSCVGCGRCVQKCPQMLNIVKVIKALGEENND